MLSWVFILSKKMRVDKEGWRRGRKQKGGDDMGMMWGVEWVTGRLRLSEGVSCCPCTSTASYSCHPYPHSSSTPHLTIVVQVGMKMVQNPKKGIRLLLPLTKFMITEITKPNCFGGQDKLKKTSNRPRSFFSKAHICNFTEM